VCCRLRLSAWDLSGRTTEISAKVIIDTAQKNRGTVNVTDNSYFLAGHTLAFTRSLDTLANNTTNINITTSTQNTGTDLGNWQLPFLNTQLSSDQPATTDIGATAPWQEGARVW
jgi:hypothetical protein